MSEFTRYDGQAYGQAGSFSGRKCVHPPGGHSSINLGYDPIRPSYDAPKRGLLTGIAPMQPPGGRSSLSLGGYGGAPSSYGSYGPQYLERRPPTLPQGGQYGGQDLSAQLNLPQGGRPAPHEGRRSAPAAASAGAGPASYGVYNGAYGSGITAPNSGYPTPGGYAGGGASAPSGRGGFQYGTYVPTPPYSTPLANNNYGAPSQASSSPYGGVPSPGGYGQAPSYATPYGGGGNGYGGGGGGAGNGYGNGSMYGGANGYGGGGGGYQQQSPQAPSYGYNASFQAGQKGMYGGKIAMQPPGGRTSINLFG